MSREDINPEDPLPALRAEIDQMLAMAPELTRTYRSYFEAFTDKGFSESQALYLTAAQVLQNPGKAP